MHRRKRIQLATFPYIGFHRYSFTLSTHLWRRCFANAAVVGKVSRQLLQLADEEQFAIPAYCFMPDHLHLYLVGTRTDSDARRFITRFKQHSGYWFSTKARMGRLWHRGSWDRILHDDEAGVGVIRYIFMNPVQAGLADHPLRYRFSGSSTLSPAALETLFADL
jgi:REP-associated tyrosine transposase